MVAFNNFLPETLLTNSKLKKKAQWVTTTWQSRNKDPVEASAQTIIKNVRTNGYLQYGLYWWAVKRILLTNGFFKDDNIDVSIASVYRGESDLKTLILAYEFADYYNGNFYQGTREFDINDTDNYVLFDDELELGTE